MNHSPNPSEDPKLAQINKRALEIFGSLPHTTQQQAGKIKSRAGLGPALWIRLLSLAQERPQAFESIFALANTPGIQDRTLRRLVHFVHGSSSDKRLGQLLEAVSEIGNIKMHDSLRDAIFATIASATALCWRLAELAPSEETNDILAFGHMIIELSKLGFLPSPNALEPRDLRLVRVILERSYANPLAEYVQLKQSVGSMAFISEAGLNAYYDEHRYILGTSERSIVVFSDCSDGVFKTFSLRELGRTFASKFNQLSVGGGTALAEALGKFEPREGIGYYFASALSGARLTDADVGTVLQLAKQLGNISRLAPDKLGVCLDFLRQLSSEKNSPKLRTTGIRVLSEILKDNQTSDGLSLLRDYVTQNDMTSIERAVFSYKLREFARVMPDRPVADVVAELRSASARGLNAPDEGIILATANIVKQILEQPPTTSLPNPPSSLVNPRGTRQPELSDSAWIEYGIWARAWCKEFFGFAPNTSQLFAVILGAKQMKQSLQGGGSGAWIELATGEGKSLVLALMAGFQVLQGKTVTITTPNNYLAERDGRLFAPFFSTLGARALGLDEVARPDSQLAPRKFVLYTTIKDLIYHSISMTDRGQKLLGGARLDVILLDEVDALLIDHGMQQHWVTQTIGIEPPATKAAAHEYWQEMQRRRGELSSDPLASAAYLAEVAPDKYGRVDPILLSFHAGSAFSSAYYKVGVDFAVRKGSIIPIDRVETERLLPNTVWIHGLHQIVALSRGLPTSSRGRVIGTSTPYDVVRQYGQIFCCSGTIGNQAERSELQRVYGLIGSHIPVNNTSIRVDEPLKVFRTDKELMAAIWAKLQEVHATKRPILLVADSIRRALKLRKLSPAPCQFLTDLQNRDSSGEVSSEEKIIDQAGRAGMITIATAMVGRGTDIKLDSDAIAAGGLFVLICGVPELQRGEAQIRRRAARQGQPGGSLLYTSIESDRFLRGLPKDALAVFTNELKSPSYTPGDNNFYRRFEFTRNAQTLTRSTKRQLMVRYREEIREGILRYINRGSFSPSEPWVNDLLMFPGQVASLLVNHHIRTMIISPPDSSKHFGTLEFEELGRLFKECFGFDPPLFEGRDTEDQLASDLFRTYSRLLSISLETESLLTADEICRGLWKYREDFFAQLASSKKLRLDEWGGF